MRRAPAHETVAAAAHVGLDISDHQARPLTIDLIDHDGADLIVTMTREHLRAVVALSSDAWTRTFTLKELSRRAGELGGRSTGWREWTDALAEGRQRRDVLVADPGDDLRDPFGRAAIEHELMVRDVDQLTRNIARFAPTAGPS